MEWAGGGRPHAVAEAMSALPPKAEPTSDLRTTPAASYLRTPPSRPPASQHSRAWGVRFLVDITPCKGSAAAAVGPAQYRSWQGRLISVRAIFRRGCSVAPLGRACARLHQSQQNRA